jgi:glycosyltransferase involved in cell wall biosynthesis
MKIKQSHQIKIAICLDGFRHGGTQQAIIHLLPYFCKTFEKVYLIILQQNNSDLRIPSYLNLEIIRFNSNKFNDIRLFKNLLFFFWRSKTDIIIASMFRAIVFTALTKNYSSKLFWMEQNTYVMRTKIHWKLLKFLSPRVFKIICISNDVADYTSSKISNRNKIVTIPNPILIPNSNVNPQNRKNDFIFVGRLAKQKNPGLALESFNVFLKTYNIDARLHIIGDGELMQDLKTIASKNGILSNCIFHGFLDNKEVYSILKITKTLISTSFIEGLAMVRSEALINGNCLVTTESGGTRQYFHTDSDIGVFVADDNKFDFSQKMYESLNQIYWSSDVIKKRVGIGTKFSPVEISSLYIKAFNL